MAEGYESLYREALDLVPNAEEILWGDGINDEPIITVDGQFSLNSQKLQNYSDIRTNNKNLKEKCSP